MMDHFDSYLNFVAILWADGKKSIVPQSWIKPNNKCAWPLNNSECLSKASTQPLESWKHYTFEKILATSGKSSFAVPDTGGCKSRYTVLKLLTFF